jgi:hypothetical protein
MQTARVEDWMIFGGSGLSVFASKISSPIFANAEIPTGELASNLMALAAFVVAISGLYAKVSDGLNLRAEVRELRAMIREMIETIRIDREVIDKAHKDHGIELPKDYKRRSFDKSVAEDTAENLALAQDSPIGPSTGPGEEGREGSVGSRD